MSEFLRSWTLSLAGIIVFGSLCEMILPSGVYKKYIHLAIGLMLCLAILSPIAGKKIEIGDEIYQEEAYAASVDMDKEQRDRVLSIYEKKLCRGIKAELEKYTDLEFDVKCAVCEEEEDFGSIENVWITVDAGKGEKLSPDAVYAIKELYGLSDECISIKYIK